MQEILMSPLMYFYVLNLVKVLNGQRLSLFWKKFSFRYLHSSQTCANAIVYNISMDRLKMLIVFYIIRITKLT